MAAFKIAAAQIPSVGGDVDRNIAMHAQVMAAAGKHAVSLVVFPELSLTGYEPELAAELAMTEADSRLAPLIALARQHGIHAVVGAPLHNGAAKPYLGAIVIGPGGDTMSYRKMHLGGGEPTYFVPGEEPFVCTCSGHRIGLAICADSSNPTHPQTYAERGASIYATGVFLNAEWYAADVQRLAGYAPRHRLLVVMANHGASVGSDTSVGKSAIWAPDGELLAGARGDEASLIIAESRNGSWNGDVTCI